MSRRNHAAIFAAILAAHALACSTEAGDGAVCSGAKCDDLDKPDSEIPATICDGVMVDVSGRGHDKVAGRLHDPLAEAVFKSGESCPTTFQDIMARLREVDTAGCDGDERAGIATRAVSETAQATGKPTSYRLVTTRTCGQRTSHEILFSLFGVRAGATSLPGNVEIMAFDATQGVYNYYESDGSSVNFFGNSKDLLKGSDGDTRRCANCHVGGGVVMKELDTPWLHWEGHVPTPGVPELIAAHPDLGSHADGLDMEFLARGGNTQWNAKRIEFLRGLGDTKKLLEPLFCSVEINVGSGASFASPVTGGTDGSALTGIPVKALVDEAFGKFGLVTVTPADYDALIKANGQVVKGIPGAIDTIIDYAFVDRADIDADYVQQLVAAGIVDDELVRDVLAVDLTRPAMSDERCDLLDLVPGIAADALSPAAIRDGLLAELGSPAAGSPAAELKNNLLASGGHDATVDGFLAACRALPPRTFLDNALRVTSLNRDRARQRAVMEFPATMPDDNLTVAAGSRLDPRTCQLTTSFVAVAPAVDASLSESFDGPGASFDDGTGQGSHDADWSVWYDGDKWGRDYRLGLQGGVQSIRLTRGSWGLQRGFGNVGGKQLSVKASFTGGGWYEILAGDTLLVKHETAFDGTDTFTLPPGTTTIRFKVGSLAESGTHEAKIDHVAIQ